MVLMGTNFTGTISGKNPYFTLKDSMVRYKYLFIWKILMYTIFLQTKLGNFLTLGGDTVMFWGAFSWNGVVPLHEIKPYSNSEDYQCVLQETLLPVGTRTGGRGWIFQQNAKIHTSRSTKEWLERKKNRLLPWPSKSPDLNPIENLWGIVSRRVYGHEKQYATKTELAAAIHNEWNSLPLELLQKLIVSMKNRIFYVIRANGGNSN